MSPRVTEHQWCVWEQSRHVSCIIQMLGHVTEDPFQFHESNKLCGT